MADQKNYITPEGFATLEAEFHQLLKVERPEVVRTVAWAASNGDRSENGDYIYGKRRLREIDRRVRFLRKRLDRVQVVDPAAQVKRNTVFFGATVTLHARTNMSAAARSGGPSAPSIAQGVRRRKS